MPRHMEEAGQLTETAGHDRPPRLSERLLRFADRRRWWLFGAVVLLYAAGFTGRWRVAPHPEKSSRPVDRMASRSTQR
jgi:hypothetical protein